MLAKLDQDDWIKLGFLRPCDDSQYRTYKYIAIPFWTSTLLQWTTNPHHKIYLALIPSQQEAIGFVAYSINNNTRTEEHDFKQCDSWIWWLAIAPDHRKKGYGAYFLNQVKMKLPSCSCLGISVEQDNTIAQHLYEKFGFISQGAWEHTLIWMQHQLQ